MSIAKTVYGCHCPGDMAVCMSKLKVIPRRLRSQTAELIRVLQCKIGIVINCFPEYKIKNLPQTINLHWLKKKHSEFFLSASYLSYLFR